MITLTAENIKQYGEYKRIIEKIADKKYDAIFHYVCLFKQTVAAEIEVVKLTTEDNFLNRASQKQSGGENYIFGAYPHGEKCILLNMDAIARAAIEYEWSTGELMFNTFDTLAHELTHYMQFLNDEEFDMITDYYERAHEVEAREIGGRVAHIIMEEIIKEMREAK